MCIHIYFVIIYVYVSSTYVHMTNMCANAMKMPAHMYIHTYTNIYQNFH